MQDLLYLQNINKTITRCTNEINKLTLNNKFYITIITIRGILFEPRDMKPAQWVWPVSPANGS